MKSVLVVLCLFIALNAQAKLKNFSQVDEGVFRGSLPTSSADFDELRARGVRTVISLHSMPFHIDPVRRGAEKAGLKFISEPIVPITLHLEKSQVENVVNAMIDPENRPVYVQCLLGQDRTGLAVALYRIHIQNWPAKIAEKEMLDKGFKPVILPTLYRFFKDHRSPGSLRLNFAVGAHADEEICDDGLACGFY